MANELTYQSVFTGQEMDERFTAVAQLQAALLEVETALSAKYVKPASGIPETDLDSAVQSALAKARSAVQDLSNYYTKTEIDSLLAAVNSQEYVDVATLPTASASTLGKIYLVGPTDNQYDRYYTSYDGSAYSWVAAGSTEINLSNYATKAELNQLDQKLLLKIGSSIHFREGFTITTNGAIGSTVDPTPGSYAAMGYAIVDASEGDRFAINGTGADSARLWCFVDEDYKILSQSTASLAGVDLFITAPANAAKLILNIYLASAGTSYNFPQVCNKYDSIIGKYAIPLLSGYAITTNGAVGSTVNMTPSANSGYAVGVADISAGDILFAFGSGGSAPRLWCFVDSANKILSQSAASIKGGGMMVVAPTNAAKVIINNASNTVADSFILYKNMQEKVGSASEAVKKIPALEERIELTEELLTQIPDPYLISGYLNTSGVQTNNVSYKCTPFIQYQGGKIKIINSYNGASSLAIAFYDSDKAFISGVAGPGLTPESYELAVADIPSGTSFVRCSTNIGAETTYFIYGRNGNDFFQRNLLPTGYEKMKVLIFGDSITDCASLTINANDETTAYTLNHPSNSYRDGNNVLIQYDMWPYFLKGYFNAFDLRDYAKSGASYQDKTRESGYERQNLSYQIEVAFNDLSNPNNVFPTTGQFSPDVVIFALGTNDAINDTYADAMAKTVMNAGETAVDIPATLANLDRTKFHEAVRYAFLKVKAQFPTALSFCVLPIQRADKDVANLHDAIKAMANYYSIKVIDGSHDCGICKDLETKEGLGVLLKDGLHPNEKGQNLLARMIIGAVKDCWLDPVWLN